MSDVAPGYKRLTSEQVRKLQRIEGKGDATGVLAGLIDDALDVALSEIPSNIPQANISGLVSDLAAKLDAAKLVTIDSAASVGGGVTEALTFTGMLATDTVLALTGMTAGANAAAVNAFGAPGVDSLSVTFTADPGAGAVVRALVLRA